ncbi:ABC transporter permease [Pigmentibacter ruber]|uniref:ABC transporter permease n=1 Tax=Pigmentibacter ruber TaxID=2683196 RepID=UPI00131D3DD5|nr:ABC transporter permease [Pigmentibacter ruber]BFD31026.1 ABC transporter permease [Pigmentibacter ruber]
MNIQEYLKKEAEGKSWLPGFGVFEREVRRFFAVPAQTILAPFGSAILYFGLFGLALGKLISKNNDHVLTHGYDYVVFLIPGIIAMEVVNAGLQNPMSSIMIAKWSGTIVDVLMAPLSPFAMWFAYISGAVIRSLIVTLAVLAAGFLCAWTFIPFNPFLLIIALFLATGIFGSIGIAAGAVCKSWDQVGILISFIVQPLIFFSGVFFSFNTFPEWIQFIRYFNPIFYIVSMFRFSILGISDTSPLISFSVSILFFILTSVFSVKVLKSGFGLRA